MFKLRVCRHHIEPISVVCTAIGSLLTGKCITSSLPPPVTQTPFLCTVNEPPILYSASRSYARELWVTFPSREKNGIPSTVASVSRTCNYRNRGIQRRSLKLSRSWHHHGYRYLTGGVTKGRRRRGHCKGRDTGEGEMFSVRVYFVVCTFYW